MLFASLSLVLGPHLAHTGHVKAMHLHKVSSAQFTVAATDQAVTLQRVYGVAFSSKSDLKDWQTARVEAAKRDHRVVGKQQKLFMISDMSPGLNPARHVHSSLIN
jgi:threonyl-tRNA synthetase